MNAATTVTWSRIHCIDTIKWRHNYIKQIFSWYNWVINQAFEKWIHVLCMDRFFYDTYFKYSIFNYLTISTLFYYQISNQSRLASICSNGSFIISSFPFMSFIMNIWKICTLCHCHVYWVYLISYFVYCSNSLTG